MSDTITPKERAEWRNRLKNGYFDPDHLHELTLRLLDALESAEARVKARNKHIHTLMSEALENERNFDGMKSQWQTSEAEVARLQAELTTVYADGNNRVDELSKYNARLTAERDWLAQKIADVESTDEDGRYVLTCPNSELRAVDHDCDKIACPQCWKEAASRAVAAGEG